MKLRVQSFILAALPMAALSLTACNRTDPKPDDAKAPVHEHHAPHGGALVELGEGEFAHLELLLDPAQGLLTAYSLDGEAENPIRLKQDKLVLKLGGLPGAKEQSLALTAQPNGLTGETVGDTSEFAGRSDALRGAAVFTGSVQSVTTKGQRFDNVAFSYPKGSEEEKK